MLETSLHFGRQILPKDRQVLSIIKESNHTWARGGGGGGGGVSPLLKVKHRIPPPEKDFLTPTFSGKIIFIDSLFEFRGKIIFFKKEHLDLPLVSRPKRENFLPTKKIYHLLMNRENFGF